MPEYLAPGVYVEETSFRSKSIEGVGTTTTGFVGPCRFGPLDLVPDILTSLSDFERCYGDRYRLAFEGEGPMHNYLWHAVRAFFEEGGKRLYAARAFRPARFVDPNQQEYRRPDEHIENDVALASNGKYLTDGHARLWLTPASRAVAEAGRAVAEVAVDLTAVARHLGTAAAAASADPYLDQTVLAALTASTAAHDQARAKLPALLDKAAAAKLLLPAATIDGADLDARLKQFKIQLDLCTVTDANLDIAKVLDPALNALLTAVKVGVGGTLSAAATAAAALRDFTPANVGDPTVSAELKTAADALNKACVGDTATDPAPATNATDYRTKYDAAVLATGLKVEALESLAYALSLKGSLVAAQASADKLTAAPIIDKFKAVQTAVGKLQSAVTGAALALRQARHPRAFALSGLGALGQQVSVALDSLQRAAVATRDAALSQPPASKDDALLLRGRFPGSFGNLKLRLGAQLGQNVLTGDPAGSGKATVPGLQPGDLVWIGPRDGSGGDLGKLYLANLKSDGSDWHFSEDGTTTTAKYWLNDSATASAPRLAPASQAVRSVSASLEIEGFRDAWAGLAFQPEHRSINGVADALLDRFKPKLASAQEARTVPLEILAGKNIRNGRQVFEALFDTSAAAEFSASNFPLRVVPNLTGGNDGARPGADEYAGRGDGPDDPKTGLKAFEDIEDISIVAAPGATFGYQREFGDQARQTLGKLIAHAENMRYRVAILDSGDNQSIQEVRSLRARLDSKHAALYYPWVRILDPVTREEISLPPSGFVAGIYARNDIDRAVYKAPANEVVRGAIGFETLLNKAQQDVLNPEGVNCFRYFEGRGYRLWGARTISSDPEWKYLNVRRYFAYLEHSIDRGTQWAVFEPNGDSLWANVRETIGDFLYNEWRSGALLGTTAEKAFFVRCDRSTMTQNDLDNGRLVCQIGVAVVKPAEYVIFRIGQWTADRKN